MTHRRLGRYIVDVGYIDTEGYRHSRQVTRYRRIASYTELIIGGQLHKPTEINACP